ncbi:hypothetical protein Pelo_15873 [Pelomyxa schiedti]|nr:hypothetical protein Pelo_15873 [Pelomyxa schiedti]
MTEPNRRCWVSGITEVAYALEGGRVAFLQLKQGDTVVSAAGSLKGPEERSLKIKEIVPPVYIHSVSGRAHTVLDSIVFHLSSGEPITVGDSTGGDEFNHHPEPNRAVFNINLKTVFWDTYGKRPFVKLSRSKPIIWGACGEVKPQSRSCVSDSLADMSMSVPPDTGMAVISGSRGDRDIQKRLLEIWVEEMKNRLTDHMCFAEEIGLNCLISLSNPASTAPLIQGSKDLGITVHDGKGIASFKDLHVLPIQPILRLTATVTGPQAKRCTVTIHRDDGARFRPSLVGDVGEGSLFLALITLNWLRQTDFTIKLRGLDGPVNVKLHWTT